MAEVPTGLWLIESYLNSIDVETGKDDLSSVPRMRRWLTEHGREAAALSATPEDLALAREVRAELREMLRGNCNGEALTSQRTREGGLVTEQPHPVAGTTQVLAPPYRIDGERLPVRRPPPQLGADRDSVLRDWLG